MKKKLKGTHIAILSFLLALVLCLGGLAFWVMGQYRARGLSLMEELEGAWRYDGIHILSESGDRLMTFTPLPPEYFTSFEKKSADLSAYGFEGVSLSYYDVGGMMIVDDPRYEGFWTVSRTDRFVYLAENGEKYAIRPQESLVYPILSGSVEGVDPTGKELVAFSARGSYAVGLGEESLVIYHTDPMDDSFHVVEYSTLSLADYGKVSFGGFVNDTQCYFTSESEGEISYYALNCPDGTVVASPRIEGELGPVTNRIYAQVTDPEKEKKEEYPVSWSNLLLGTVKRGDLKRKVDRATLEAVSPDGALALFRTEQDGGEDLAVVSEKRAFFVSSVLGEGETAGKAVFCHDNVLMLTVNTGEKTVTRFYSVLFS